MYSCILLLNNKKENCKLLENQKPQRNMKLFEWIHSQEKPNLYINNSNIGLQ